MAKLKLLNFMPRQRTCASHAERTVTVWKNYSATTQTGHELSNLFWQWTNEVLECKQ